MTIFIRLFLFLQLISCGSENSELSSEQSLITSSVQTSNNNSNSNISILDSPNLNKGPINFEQAILSFSEQNLQPSNRASGNWGRFGGIGSVNLAIEYSDNPDRNGPVIIKIGVKENK